jgi:beta-glucosidase
MLRSHLLALTMLAVPLAAAAQNGGQLARPWRNTALSPDERASLLVKELTLAEKIQLAHGIGWGPLQAGAPVPADNNGGAGEVLGIPRLGIPSLQQADSAVGVRMSATQSRYSTALPGVLALAATWDTQAAYLYGDVIGRELRAQGFNQSIGGGTNLARDPRDGRLFEYPGEDPVLAGVSVGNLICGVQHNLIMGDIKHFALNNQETKRETLDVHIDHKAARESDLLAFEIGIRIGHPASVMCSYNKVNGEWACENDWLLNHVLKGQWKYPGFVVSDWDATHSTGKAALAGLDLQQPGEEYFGKPLAEAVKAGMVPMSRLDDMVHRLLRSMIAAGVIDHPPMPRTVVNPFTGRDDAQRIAEEAIVLLKNASSLLPLDAAKVQHIAVIGNHADKGVSSGGGSSQVDAPGGNAIDPARVSDNEEAVYFPSAPLTFLRQHAPGANVQFDEGTDIAAAVALAKSSEVAIVFADQHMNEGVDVPSLSLPGKQDELIHAVAQANPRTIVVLTTGGPVTMPWLDEVSGVFEAWYPGIGGGEAIANLIFGTVNPSGKLPVTFAKSEQDLPHKTVFGQGNDLLANFDEGARFGYKWFDSEDKKPLFEFGYGLSYTRYSYSDLKVDGAHKTATVTIENVGGRDGTETAQVYVQLPKTSGEHFRRLAGWQRVPLKAGERKTVTIPMEPLSMASFDTSKDDWQWLPGKYVVSAGGSSRSLPLQATVAIP